MLIFRFWNVSCLWHSSRWQSNTLLELKTSRNPWFGKNETNVRPIKQKRQLRQRSWIISWIMWKKKEWLGRRRLLPYLYGCVDGKVYNCFSQKTVSFLARFKYRSLARSLRTPLSMKTTLYVMIFFKCDETGVAKPSLTDLIHNWDIYLLLFQRDKPFGIW